MIKKANGVRGYLMKLPTMKDGDFERDAEGQTIFKTVFRVYDENKQFTDYEIKAYDLEIEIIDKYSLLNEGPDGNSIICN